MGGARPRPSKRSSGLSTALLGGLVAAVSAWAVTWLLTVAPAAYGRPGTGPAGPLLAVAAIAAAVVCARLGLTALACAAHGASTAIRVARRRPPVRSRSRAAGLALLVSPRLLRPLVTVVVAGGLAIGTAGTASAMTPAPAGGVGSGPSVLPDPGWSIGSALPAPTWTPGRPGAPARDQPDVSVVAAAATRGSSDSGSASVVVRRGDTLWSIAARHLGPGATNADIADAWPRWWQVNRDRIGDDPDLIRPGQVLSAPAVEVAR